MGQKLTRYATTEKAITLADSPYTATPNYNCIKVNTAGGNVRVNLPTADYPIDVIKTSSDSYIVTVWVASVQIGEVAGELSTITIENAEVTKDEPWFPYDAIVGIAGVSGDGGEILAKDRYGRVIAGGRGVAGTDDYSVIQALLENSAIHRYHFTADKFYLSAPLHPPFHIPIVLQGSGSTTTPADPRTVFAPVPGATISSLFYFYRISNAVISDLSFDGTGAVGDCDGIELNECVKIKLQHVHIYGCHHGLNSHNGTTTFLENVSSSYNTDTGIRIYSDYSDNLINVDASRNNVGFYFKGAHCSGMNLYTELNTTNGYIFDGCSTLTLINPYASNNGADQYNDLGNSAGCLILNARAYNTVPPFLDVKVAGSSWGIVFKGGTPSPSYLNYIINKTGSSTGTGSEQTIPHTLTRIPVGCKAWIKYPISATRFMEKEIDFDATNIYPCVNTGIAYDWRIE